MPESSTPSLAPAQVARLQRLLEAGFQFVTFEQFARYPGVEKDGFVALLDISGGGVQQFGSVGYRLREGIAVLTEVAGKRTFVWKNQSVEATPERLTAYEQIKKELAELLAGTAHPS